MTLNKDHIVICPKCGTEYLLEEIFTDSSFLGRPINTVKDALGKILYTEYKSGREPIFKEQYICDQCNTTFTAEVNLSIKTSMQSPELDFNNQTVSLLDL